MEPLVNTSQGLASVDIRACGYPDSIEFWMSQHLLIRGVYFNATALVLLPGPGKLVLYVAANSDNVCMWNPIDQGMDMAFALHGVSIAIETVNGYICHATKTCDGNINTFVRHAQQSDATRKTENGTLGHGKLRRPMTRPIYTSFDTSLIYHTNEYMSLKHLAQ
jgi:hypothetical protein